MKSTDIKSDKNLDYKESQIIMNINNPSFKENYVIKSSKNLGEQPFQSEKNDFSEEEYLKRNSPMQSMKTLYNLNFKKEEKIDNNFLPLTPQIVSIDQKYLNKKYFPSKANVCKGCPDSNKKFIFPTSSPIFQYFASGNVDNLIGGDKGFSLENGNTNCFGERASHLSNISQNDIFNCSPSEFFNRTSYGVNADKNLDGFLMNEPEGGEDDKNKFQKEEELYTLDLEMGNLDLNYKDDDNSILNKINEMKNKKSKEKMNINNCKGNKNLNNNKNNDNLKNKIKENNNIDSNNKDNNVNNPIQNTIEKMKKAKKKSKDIKNSNNINNKKLNENNNKNNKKENLLINNNEVLGPNEKKNDNILSIEENNQCEGNQNISVDFSKRIEDYLDHFDEHSSPVILKKDDNNNFRNNNINNNLVTNNKNNFNENNNLNKNFNMNYNNQNRNNNININPRGIVDKKNMNYINGMNIRCTNLNINNFTNLNNNISENIYNDQNQQLFNYLRNQNNPNNLMFNQNLNFMGNDNFPTNNNIPNINNYNNNFYNNLQTMNLLNMNLMNQINPTNIPAYYFQNNLIQGYPYFSNNTINNNQNNNLDLIKNKGGQKIIMNNNNNNNSINSNNNLSNNKNINNSNQSNNEQKKKKIKRLETSSYIDKPLSYISENLSLLGKDQGACRYIQKLLNDNPNETIKVLYEPLCKNILQLINDPFGNYLIQKIITYLNEEQLYEILKIISPFFFEICCNTHGTRVLQKLIDHCTAPKVKNYFFELLKPLITPLLKQLNGTFVVQKFAEVNNNEYAKQINEIIVENAPVLSTHRHGCCVIQKYLELKDPIMTPHLLDKLIDNCLLLIIDQFGNYVIQSILLMGDKKYGNRLAEKIAENVVYYAKHKYSSNVVEKCFDYCDGIYLENLMTNVQKKDNLTELILDEHGNYVVQKVLSLSKPNIQKTMLRIIVPLFEKLRNYSYGERVINRLLLSYPIINDNSLFADENKAK